jgi:hypothetical protein
LRHTSRRYRPFLCDGELRADHGEAASGTGGRVLRLPGRTSPYLHLNHATMSILVIILIILLIAAVPAWPYSRGWGYGPSGILGVIVLILIILLLMGRI